MRSFSKIRTKYFGYKVDPEVVIAYRTAIPSSIDLQINTKGDHFIATIKSVENKKLPKDTLLITEAKTPDALVDMVNDLIFAYKNIPENYRPFYRKILQPKGSVSRTENLTLVKAT